MTLSSSIYLCFNPYVYIIKMNMPHFIFTLFKVAKPKCKTLLMLQRYDYMTYVHHVNTNGFYKHIKPQRPVYGEKNDFLW